jgi:hypothetical protein
MNSQQKKIEEQRAVIQHLRQRLEKEEKSVMSPEITGNSRVPCILNMNLKNDETFCRSSENLPVKLDTSDKLNDSDSAINTDSGSESSKLSGTDLTMIEARHSRKFSNPEETKLSRSLSDLHMCKHLREQYLRKRQTHAVYPNHRSVQRPRDVKKRHWRKSALGIDLEETFIFNQ